MCTVVCRWDPADSHPVQLLAVRDERRTRAFDLPGRWWPEHPGLIGGRDRQAGGTWCASVVGTATTAVVLNRPERREAAAGAASRGVLPLLAATSGAHWIDEIDVTGMAGFNVVLAQPNRLHWWSFDGETRHDFALDPGVHVFKPNGLVATTDERLLGGRARLDDQPDAATDAGWGDWFAALTVAVPSEDGTGLLVRRRLDDGDHYESVFAQFIAARPGRLRLDYLADPASRGPWTTRLMTG
jgi:uncharacterized protein with NRDE domain